MIAAYGHGVCPIAPTPARFRHGTDLDGFMVELSYLPDCRVYFHNLAFDGSFIFDWVLNHEWDYVDRRCSKAYTFSCVISDMNQVYSITLNFEHGHKVEIYDSLKIIPMKLAKVAKTFGMEMSKGEIDYNRHRPIGYELDEIELDYLRRDVLILASAVDTMIKQGETKMTAGSNALADYKRMVGGSKGFRKLFPVLGEDEDSFMRMAYRGGFTYANPLHRRKEVENVSSWDVNSLYPSVMYGCHGERMPYGAPRWFEGEPHPTAEYPLWIAQLQCEFKLKPGHIPCHQFRKNLMFRGSEYVVDSKGEQCFTLTNVDFKLLCEQYDVRVTQWNGGYLFKATDTLFTDYIDKWTEVKIQAGRDGNGGMRQIAKLHLNSLYGKFATRPQVQSRYPVLDENRIVRYRDLEPETREPIYPPVGIFTTAYGRAYTIRFAQACGDKFVYSDTDSVKLIGMEPPEGAFIDDYELGAFSKDGAYRRFKAIGPKAYVGEDYDTGELIIHCSGLPESCYDEVTFDNFEEGAEYKGKLVQNRTQGGIYFSDGSYKLLPRL